MKNILNLIEQESSSKTKIKIIEQLPVQFQNLLQHIYENCYGDQKYFIKKLPEITESGYLTIDNAYSLFEVCLKRLADREFTGKAAIEFITKRIGYYTKEDQKWLIRILMKDLKIGVSKKRFESIFGRKEGNYTVSLAENLDKIKNINVLDGTFYASRKLDGVRCVAIIKIVDKQVVSLELKSRQGKTFTTLDNLKPEIHKLCENFVDGTWVLDGEVCIVDENGDEHFDWIMKEISRKNHTIENPKYYMFDLLTGKDFFSGKGETTFLDRLKTLHYVYAKSNGKDFKHLNILDQELIENQDDFDRWSKYASDNKWEGFMLRKNDTYKGGRTKDLIKVKKFQDSEYVVIGYECGDVKYGTETFSDVVTNLHIIHKGNRVSVGSGISKEQRIIWRKKPEKIIGKTITVQYFEETMDSKTGEYSLRFPVLKYVYYKKREV